MVSYISDHIFQAPVILQKLRQISKEVHEVMNSVVLNETSPDSQYILVVNTSKKATRAVLYAQNGSGEKLVIHIF